MKRCEMLESAAEYCPPVARFLACLWKGTSLAWLESQPGEWEAVEVMEGTAQGDTSSSPSFSRGFRRVLDRIRQRLARNGVDVFLPSLMDDLVLAVPVAHADSAIQVAEEELRVAGLELQLP
eukprot:688350-Karenia_brevis.AAC.1